MEIFEIRGKLENHQGRLVLTKKKGLFYGLPQISRSLQDKLPRASVSILMSKMSKGFIEAEYIGSYDKKERQSLH